MKWNPAWDTLSPAKKRLYRNLGSTWVLAVAAAAGVFLYLQGRDPVAFVIAGFFGLFGVSFIFGMFGSHRERSFRRHLRVFTAIGLLGATAILATFILVMWESG